MNQQIYWYGDLAEYTGITKLVDKTVFYEIKLLEGHLKGQTKWTYRAPK